MTIKSKQLFILIGDDRTGKTTIQKLLIEKLCGKIYDRLPTNLCFDIGHPEIKRKYKTVSFGNRSYQEKIDEYGSVDEYFVKHFKDADISFISSHLNIAHTTDMIGNGKKMFYNVIGVFFSNSIDSNNQLNSDLSLLEWNERLIIENDWKDNEDDINRQLIAIADNIVVFISDRTSVS